MVPDYPGPSSLHELLLKLKSTVVMKKATPINLTSLPRGSGKMIKSEPANWKILRNEILDHQNPHCTHIAIPTLSIIFTLTNKSIFTKK